MQALECAVLARRAEGQGSRGWAERCTACAHIGGGGDNVGVRWSAYCLECKTAAPFGCRITPMQHDQLLLGFPKVHSTLAPN